MELLGFSRPLDTTPAHKFINTPAAGFTNSTSTDDSVVLSLQPTNSVVLAPSVIASNEDPLAFSNFLSHYQYLRTIEWSTADVGNISIATLLLDPYNMPSTRMQFVADQFAMNHTSFALRFSVVKSAFYSGRLGIEYYPPTSPVSAGFTQMVPSVIWDVRTNKEMQVSVPYTANTRYTLDSTDNDSLNVRVINPLRVADGSPTTIQILVFITALPDYNVALPRDPVFAYAHGGTPLADPDPDPIANRPDDRVICLLPRVKMNSLEDAQIVNGEATLSLRPLLTRFTPFDVFSDTTRRIDCGYFGLPSTAVPLWATSYYYQFFRGSLRYKFFVQVPPRTPAGVAAPYFRCLTTVSVTSGVATAPGVGVPITLPTNVPMHITYCHLNPSHEVTVPYFTNYDLRLINESTVLGPTLRPRINVFYDYDVTVYTIPPTITCFVAMGEDATFLYPSGSRVAT